MLDALSLDQLRIFIAAADAGSFSAAARRVRRAQSVVSDLVGRLEAQFGVRLFDRSGRYPTLTPEGAALLADARTIVADVDFMRARAKGMAAGVEAELSVVVDVMYPIAPITEAAKRFRDAFPATPLRIYVEALGSAFQLLLDGRASLGIVGATQIMPPVLMGEPLVGIAMAMVAAPDHPLASRPGPLSRAELARHTQLVLTDRSPLSEGKDFFVLSPSTWRLADIFVKRAFLLAGLGWGGMPRHAIDSDLASGQLVPLSIEGIAPEALLRPVSAAYPIAAPPGPAGRWLINQLHESQA
jgi:DNA-binding transcriptional LysR family regulator